MEGLVAWLRRQVAMDQQSARAMPHAIENLQARWSPARFLADCESKLEIIEWCDEVIGDRDLAHYGQTGALKDDPQALAVTLAIETLRRLTKPYAHLSGYREEWRP